MGGDPNTSVVVDNLGGLRSFLNHSIRELYRRKATSDSRFRHDINVTNTIAIAGGTGDVPENLMRECLPMSDITDANNSLVSYLAYSTDVQQTFSQLGYLTIVGDEFQYTAPAPDLDSYSGDLTIQCPTFPVFPNAMSQDITLPSQATADDLVLLLANAILGRESFQMITAPA